MEDDEVGYTTAEALRLHNELYLISITFLYWDHFLTFDDEVRFLWKKAKTRSTFYFFLNRYLAFFGDIVITVFQFVAVPISWSLVLLVNQCLVCLLLTIRIYALYGRDTRVYAVMMSIGAILLGVSCWAFIGKNGVPESNVVGCHIAISQKLAVYTATPWESVFTFDVLIFVALFYEALRKRRESRMMRRQNPILSILMRDGAIYFAIMAVVNLGNIITYYVAGPLLRGSLATLSSSMAVTLMSRLMLNLHSIDRSGIFSTTTSHLGFGEMSPYDSGIELDTLQTRDLERNSPRDENAPAHAILP
ncbi:hypothetical protein B0H11DRAFT_2242245 [Mycena galericulata]|nr:hypothetical protein B0H11DRAFT_2242245 [Mycena galericulata]